MKVIDLDGNETYWKLSGYSTSNRNKSSLHLEARIIIKELFPNIIVLEEVPIRVNKFQILFLDFYIPLYKKCIEVHGEQHYKFNSFFFETAHDFAQQQKKDRMKQEWCEKNNISFISLPYNVKNQWKTIIKPQNL